MLSRIRIFLFAHVLLEVAKNPLLELCQCGNGLSTSLLHKSLMRFPLLVGMENAVNRILTRAQQKARKENGTSAREGRPKGRQQREHDDSCSRISDSESSGEESSDVQDSCGDAHSGKSQAAGQRERHERPSHKE